VAVQDETSKLADTPKVAPDAGSAPRRPPRAPGPVPGARGVSGCDRLAGCC
jgi:hypothetical protein